MAGMKQRARMGIMAAAIGAATCVAFAAPTDPAPAKATSTAGTQIPETDKLQFTQKNVQAQMQELQERMFHLAELTKDAEPENSTRLLLAVRKAREELILEQMKEVLETLSTSDLSKASTQTKAVLAKLAELRNLLVATDLDLQMQLERLRQLNAAIKKLDAAIKEENREQGHAAEMAKTDPKPAALDQAKTDQEQNHKRTDEVAETVKALGNLDAAAKPLAASSNSMSQAEKSLGAGKPADASPTQQEAAKKLAEAKAELEKKRQEVIDELQKQVKGVVIENLQEMLDRQTAVRGATEKLSGRLEKERAAVLQLQQLAPAEERIATICQQTLDLVNETEFSVALPPALENLQRNMLYVSGDLTGGRGDARVIATETGIEEDLRDLLDTFKEMDLDGKAGQCKGCKGNKNKLLAELKVVRMLQLRVNKATSEADGDAHRAAAAAELPAPLKAKIGKVRDGQDAARNAMERLRDEYGPNSKQPEDDNNHDPNTI